MTEHTVSPLGRLFHAQAQLSHVARLARLYAESVAVRLDAYGAHHDDIQATLHAFEALAALLDREAARLADARRELSPLLP